MLPSYSITSLHLMASPLQRWCLYLQRCRLSSLAATWEHEATIAAADVLEESSTKLEGRRRKKNLFEVAQFLPNWGIGYKMAKRHWRDVSYVITKINLYKDGRHGKAWGIRHRAGVPVADTAVKMSGVNKKGWKYIAESKKISTEAKKAEETTPA